MLTNLINKLDDWINPIVVKEIRQYLNGRSIIPLIVFTLLLELGAMTVFMMSQIDTIQGRGQEFFSTVMVVLTLACILGVAFPCAGRISRERKVDSMDLIYTTVLSPYRIVSGKLFSGLAMVTLLISLCLPFMCVSYYLRGIDLPTILITTYFLLLFMVPTIQGMVLFGVLCSSVVYRVILLIVGGNILFSALGGLFSSIFVHGRLSGFHLGMGSPWLLVFWTTFIVLVVSAGLYVLSVAAISHVTANRSMPIRVYLAATWLVTLLICIMVSLFYAGKLRDIDIWAIPVSYVLVIHAICAISERDEQSRRVLRSVPRGRFRQLCFFLFSSGSGNGLVFSTFFLGITYVFYFLLEGKNIHDFLYKNNAAAISAGIAMYAIAYGAITLGIKGALRRFFTKINTFVVVVCLMSVVLFIPIIACALIYKERCVNNDLSAPFMVLTPAIFGYDHYQFTGLVVSALMMLGGLLLAFAELKRQFTVHFPDREVEPERPLAMGQGIENADA